MILFHICFKQRKSRSLYKVQSCRFSQQSKWPLGILR